MSTFHMVFFSALGITVASAVAAGVLVALDDTPQRDTRKIMVERLIQIALLGAGAIIALLGRFQDL
ncbi:hypothetical protein [Chelativorans sp. M5D2P16]|uniref:hypothetical protein n=1 Tax=Chelativorans sp. M5D2P16 TaxID=3095678 RepID=UPI002ACA733E|nr:hypothetical protein [Chelativorans sp. M5D2P16]MDZ5699947.1 hypothetical protein [Chelativorans sp. M5D2P16]